MAFFDKIKEVSQRKNKGKKSKEGYLVCEECGGYYELKTGESPQDFAACECGGKLKHQKKFEIPSEDTNKATESEDKKADKDIKPDNVKEAEEASKDKVADNATVAGEDEDVDKAAVAGDDEVVDKSGEVSNDKTITCPSCETENPDYSKYCQECGKEMIN